MSDKKNFFKKNLGILAALLAVIAVVLVISLVLPKHTAMEGDALSINDASSMVSENGAEALEEVLSTPEVTVTVAAAQPEETSAPVATYTDVSSIKVSTPVKGYLVVTVGNTMYAPIPLLEEKDYTVRQGAAAESPVNVIHVTKDSISMKSSNCEGQDCIDEGTVTLDNLNTRVLGNGIYCLPHTLSLQLFTAEQAAPYLQ